jgi:hypothetical protein
MGIAIFGVALSMKKVWKKYAINDSGRKKC